MGIDGIRAVELLIGASALDVARLLAAVADTLGRGLLGTVAGQMTNLATCRFLVLVELA